MLYHDVGGRFFKLSGNEKCLDRFTIYMYLSMIRVNKYISHNLLYMQYLSLTFTIIRT